MLSLTLAFPKNRRKANSKLNPKSNTWQHLSTTQNRAAGCCPSCLGCLEFGLETGGKLLVKVNPLASNPIRKPFSYHPPDYASTPGVPALQLATTNVSMRAEGMQEKFSKYSRYSFRPLTRSFRPPPFDKLRDGGQGQTVSKV